VRTTLPPTSSKTNSATPARTPPRRDGDLTRVLRVEPLQMLQESFSRLGQMTVVMCQTDGTPITTPTWGSPFSEMLGNSAIGAADFLDAVRESCRIPPPSAPAACGDGMTLYASPIKSAKRRLAVLVVGIRGPFAPPEPVLRELAVKYALDAEELVRAGAPESAATGGTPEAIRRFSDLLAATIATIYAQAETIGQQLADLRIVHGLTDLLAGTLDLQQILDLTVRQVVDVMPVKACAIRLLNESTGELVVKAVHNLSPEYLQKGPVILQESKIDAAAFAGHAVYIENAPTDPRIRYPENAKREGIVSGLCVPMTFRGRTIGVLRVYTAKRYRFNEAETQLLKSIGAQAAAAIITTQLVEGRAAAERFKQQVDAAAQIQRRMLPARPTTDVGLDFGCVYEATLQVGGDFYDFVPFSDGSLGVCIADVVGKGLPAALMMASARSSLRAHASCISCVGEIVSRVNKDLCRDTLPSEFVTLAFGIFSPDRKEFTYSSAGHLPPILVRRGEVSELDAGGLVIGVRPGEVFEEQTVAIESGDVLVFMTDGVTEAMSFHGEEYGWARVLASVRRHVDLAAQQLAQQLLWDVRRFVGLAEQSDDITIVVAKKR